MPIHAVLPLAQVGDAHRMLEKRTRSGRAHRAAPVGRLTAKAALFLGRHAIHDEFGALVHLDVRSARPAFRRRAFSSLPRATSFFAARSASLDFARGRPRQTQAHCHHRKQRDSTRHDGSSRNLHNVRAFCAGRAIGQSRARRRRTYSAPSPPCATCASSKPITKRAEFRQASHCGTWRRSTPGLASRGLCR